MIKMPWEVCCATLNEACEVYAFDLLVLFQIKKVSSYCQLSEGQCVVFSVTVRHFWSLKLSTCSS
jgi:hypothetical protein